MASRQVVEDTIIFKKTLSRPDKLQTQVLSTLCGLLPQTSIRQNALTNTREREEAIASFFGPGAPAPRGGEAWQDFLPTLLRWARDAAGTVALPPACCIRAQEGGYALNVTQLNAHGASAACCLSASTCRHSERLGAPPGVTASRLAGAGRAARLAAGHF